MPSSVGGHLKINIVPLFLNAVPGVERECHVPGSGQIEFPGEGGRNGVAIVAPPAPTCGDVGGNDLAAPLAFKGDVYCLFLESRAQFDVVGAVLVHFAFDPVCPAQSAGGLDLNVQVSITKKPLFLVEKIRRYPVLQNRMKVSVKTRVRQVTVDAGPIVGVFGHELAQAGTVVAAVMFVKVVHEQRGAAVVGADVCTVQGPVHQRNEGPSQVMWDGLCGITGHSDRQFSQAFADPGIF